MRNKSSKVETLRGAIEYIKQLKELLGEEIDYSQTLSDHDSSEERSLPPMLYQLPTSSIYPSTSSTFPPTTPLILPPSYSIPTSQERPDNTSLTRLPPLDS